MLPPVGLIIPYYLLLQRIGWLDTYRGLIAIYLTFSLPFAIWLMVSYFEDVPREMEEAALLDRAGRFRAFWSTSSCRRCAAASRSRRSSSSSTRGTSSCSPSCSAATRVRPVTVAMFNFISVEQTLWAKLAAAAMIAMAPVIVLGLIAQRHIVKGLTVGAVKGGGRR